jgi:hypothetical protein
MAYGQESTKSIGNPLRASEDICFPSDAVPSEGGPVQHSMFKCCCFVGAAQEI